MNILSCFPPLIPESSYLRLCNLVQVDDTFECINSETPLERAKVSLQPTHGSIPNLIFSPLPTCQAKPSSTNLNETIVTFHMTDAFVESFQGLWIHSSKGTGSIYFRFTTAVHRLSSVKILHPDFAANEEAND